MATPIGTIREYNDSAVVIIDALTVLITSRFFVRYQTFKKNCGECSRVSEINLKECALDKRKSGIKLTDWCRSQVHALPVVRSRLVNTVDMLSHLSPNDKTCCGTGDEQLEI